MGPAGTNTVDKCPNCTAPMNRPGTILSHTPSMSEASNTLCDKATAVAKAITSRENSESSMPASPWVMPSHMAGTPPATWALAPSRRASSRSCSG